MADTNKYQRQLDELILQQERLKDKVEQANASLDHFRTSTASTSAADELAAQKRLEAAEKEKRFFESMLEERKRQIKEHADDAGVKVKERSFKEISQEDNIPKSGFSMANFKASLESKGGMSGKAGIAAGVMNIVSDAFNVGTDILVAQQRKSLNTWMAEQDIYLKTLETGSKIFNRQMKTFAKGMEGAVSSSFASITQGVQEGAYSAASTSIDFATDMLKNTYETKLDRLKLLNYKAIRQEQAELENLKLSNQQLIGAVSFVGGIANMFGPVGAAVGGLVTSIAKSATKMMETESEISFEKHKKRIEIAEKKLETLNEAQSNAVDAAQQATSKVLDFSKAIENLSLKTDAAAKSMANVIGMSSSNADMYERFIYGATRNLKFTDSTGKTTYLNKNAEDMLKMQSQYIESSGRNGTMSQNDFVKTFQLGKVIGDDNLAAALLGDMDYFNKSIATGTDLIYEMFQQANKAGVSNRKFAKDLQQNLKLAQKYTFKGGTEAMMKMSIWAQKVRFNMQGLEGMVDKIQDGGLEGVITQGARLQVLGGNMAMGADPIAMMYESWADPEALAKRFTDMTKGTGHFNSKTGEVDIVGADAMRLKQYAEAIGMDYKDARAQVTQRIKGEQIDKQLTKNYTDEQKALIYNKAKLGENGQWQVTLDNGQVKNVNDLQGTDWNSLMPTEESIEDYVSKIYNLLEQQGGVTNFAQSVMADETFENLKSNIQDRIAENLRFVNEDTSELKGILEKANNFVTEQNKIQHENMIATSAILDQEFDIMKSSVQLFTKTMSDGTSELRKALDLVKADLNYQLNPTEENARIRAEKEDALSKDIFKSADGEGLDDRSEAKAWYKTGNLGGEAFDDNYVKYAYQMFNALNQSNGLSQDNLKTLANKYTDISGIGSFNREEDGYENTQNIADILRNYRELYLQGKINANGYKEQNGKKVTESEYLNSAFGKALERAIENANMFSGLNYDQFDNEDAVLEYIQNNYDSGSFVNTQDSIMKGNIKPLIPAASSVTPIHDGVAIGGNRPMSVAASSVTPIHDGVATIAQSDPQDSAIFAKTGGPFDTLFNGIFNRIDALYEAYQDPVLTPNATIETLPMEDTNVGDVIRHQWDIATSKDTYSHSSTYQPMELKISGSLDLQSGGQSVDIMGMLRDNPLFIRELSRLLASQLSNAQNGGRGGIEFVPR